MKPKSRLTILEYPLHLTPFNRDNPLRAKDHRPTLNDVDQTLKDDKDHQHKSEQEIEMRQMIGDRIPKRLDLLESEFVLMKKSMWQC